MMRDADNWFWISLMIFVGIGWFVATMIHTVLFPKYVGRHRHSGDGGLAALHTNKIHNC